MYYERVKEDLTKFMKSGDKITIRVVRSILTKVTVATKAKNSKFEPTDENMLVIFNKELKELNEERDGYVKRNDEVLIKEMDILIAYVKDILPKQLTTNELLVMVKKLMSDDKIPNPIENKDMGKAIKLLSDECGDKANKGSIARTINIIRTKVEEK